VDAGAAEAREDRPHVRAPLLDGLLLRLDGVAVDAERRRRRDELAGLRLQVAQGDDVAVPLEEVPLRVDQQVALLVGRRE
jgi:hypothetical protein